MGLKSPLRLLIFGTIILSACSAGSGSAYPTPPIVIRTVEVMVEAVSGISGPVATEAPALTMLMATQVVDRTHSFLPYPASGAYVWRTTNLGGEAMVIKDAQMELLVDDINLAIEQVTQEAKDQGGYLLSSQVWNREDEQRAELRLNVPADHFEQTLNYLRHLGIKVLSESASGQDVSMEYTDLQSRLANLEATAARVRGFLDDARTVEDALRINAELSNLEGQIEQIKGMMRYYENRAAFSSIYLLLTTDLPTPTPTPPPAWSPGNTVQDAASAMVSVWQTIVDGLIWIAVLGWPILVLILLLWLFWRYRKRSRDRMKPPN